MRIKFIYEVIKMTSTIGLHFKKHKNGTTGLKRHVERKPGQKHANEHIKPELTKDNIFLAGNRNLSYQQRIDNIIKSQLGDKKIRSDAVKLVTTTVQLGGDITNQSKSDQISTLKSAFDILKNDFGEENIVSAVIHLDETTPHLHFDFVPIIDNKLSARALLGNKFDLRNRQSKFLSDIQAKHSDFNFSRKTDQQFNGLEQKLFEKMTEQVKLKNKLVDDKIVNFVSEAKIRRSELDERELGVITREKELEQRETSLNASEDKLKNQIDKFNNYQRNAVKKNKDKETELNQRSVELDEKAANLDKKESMLNNQQMQLNEQELRQKNKEIELEKKQKELEDRELQIKQEQEERQKELERRKETVTERERELVAFESQVSARVSGLVSDFNERLKSEKLTLESISNFEQVVKSIELDNNQRGSSFER